MWFSIHKPHIQIWFNGKYGGRQWVGGWGRSFDFIHPKSIYIIRMQNQNKTEAFPRCCRNSHSACRQPPIFRPPALSQSTMMCSHAERHAEKRKLYCKSFLFLIYSNIHIHTRYVITQQTECTLIYVYREKRKFLRNTNIKIKQ